MSRHERVLLDGEAGRIEVFVEEPDSPRGIALIAHPHPLFGGTADNKVVTTLARAFRDLGYATLRPSFRGVGGSDGEHTHGVGETDDLFSVHGYSRRRFGTMPLALAGFSFGAYVTTLLARRLVAAGEAAERLVLIGTASGFVEGARTYETEAVPADTIVIHGANDQTVPLANVLAWAEALELPVVVVPGADHFFHRKLHLIRDIIRRSWHR